MYSTLAIAIFFLVVSNASSSSPACNTKFPTATNGQEVPATIPVTANKDFGMVRLVAGKGVGGSTVNENDQPILLLEPGVTVSNNVWWESVGTHAAGFGTDTQYWANVNNKYTVQGGGAQNAADKMFIQQGAGTTTITNFYAYNGSKLYQSCGDCPTQFKQRHLIINTSTFQGYVCQGYEGNTNYNGTNFQQAPVEKMKPGEPLNGIACNDPHANIVIAN
uniref:Probable pectate lyase F n=1 Tax=Ditylenchus dipsaci TaxID=166011 RepID=A0A915DMN1_9BILA